MCYKCDKTIQDILIYLKQSVFSPFHTKEKMNHTLSMTGIIHMAGVSCLSLSLGQRIKTSTVDQAQYRAA